MGHSLNRAFRFVSRLRDYFAGNSGDSSQLQRDKRRGGLSEKWDRAYQAQSDLSIELPEYLELIQMEKFTAIMEVPRWELNE